MTHLLKKFFLFFIITISLYSNTSLAAIVQRVSWQDLDNKSKITIELSAQTKFKIFKLTSPNRIVVDLENSNSKLKNYSNNFTTNYIKNLRYGVRNTKDLRLVFDLTQEPMSFANISKQNNKIIVEALFKKELKKLSKKETKENNENVFSLIEDSLKTKISPPKTKKEIKITKSEKPVETNQDHLFPISSKDIISSKAQSAQAIFAPKEIENNSKQSKEDVRKLLKMQEAEEKKAEKIVKRKRLLKRKLLVVVIDPGHGGNDHGATGKYYATKEKDLTLEYSLALKKALEETGNYKIYLTRNSDKYESLTARRYKARTYQADIFISLHADSNPDPNMRGLSVYTLSDKAYDEESEALSNRENKSEMIGRLDLSKENKDIANLLIDLIKRDTKNNSLQFAKTVTTELEGQVKMIKDAHRFADFKVLHGIDIPALLVELGYVSNKEEEKLLNQTEYKKIIIKTLTTAINKFFKVENKLLKQNGENN